MAETIRRVRRHLNEPTQTKRKWTYGVTTTLVALSLGASGGAYRYVQNRDADFEAQTERQCLSRVDSRTEIRGMFLTVFDVIEESAGPSTTLTAARSRLDERYPELSPASCE